MWKQDGSINSSRDYIECISALVIMLTPALHNFLQFQAAAR
jgi:hypothetical protein